MPTVSPLSGSSAVWAIPGDWIQTQDGAQCDRGARGLRQA